MDSDIVSVCGFFCLCVCVTTQAGRCKRCDKKQLSATWLTYLDEHTEMKISLNSDAPLARRQISCFMKTHKTLAKNNQWVYSGISDLKIYWCPSEKDAVILMVLTFISFCCFQWITTHFYTYSCWDNAAICFQSCGRPNFHIEMWHKDCEDTQ